MCVRAQCPSSIRRRKRCNEHLPGVQEHVEGEPPELEPFVRPVNEDTVDRHRSRGIHLAHRHCVVREEAQLQQKDGYRQPKRRDGRAIDERRKLRRENDSASAKLIGHRCRQEYEEHRCELLINNDAYTSRCDTIFHV